jgi:outer membrane protein OmpA-like peptidoglycan-associated protein
VKSPAVFLAVLVCLAASPLAHAQYQDHKPTSDSLNQPPAYTVNVVSRTTLAVKYEHRSGATEIGFRGTDLMPAVSGEAKVESQRGTMKIGLELGGLAKPTSLGTEYLTYVLWAISPEGQPANLGEVLVGSNHRTKLTVTTNLQAFALLVTAEPYYAVRRPSNVVIAENEILPGTVGTSEPVDAKYELIDRGGYIPTGYHFDPVVLNSKLPLEFFEARNAVRIAKSAGADNYAADSYAKAVEQMNHADTLGTMKHVDQKELIAESREVVQTADDSREIAVKRMDADRINAAKDAEAAKLADSRANTRTAQQGRLDAEAATADANRGRERADQAAVNAGQIAANANQAASDAQQGQRNAEADSDRSRVAAADASLAAVNANQAASDAQQGQRNAEADSDRNLVAASGASLAAVNANQAASDAQQGQRNAEADSDRNRAAATDASQAAVNANQAASDAQQGQRNAEADSDRNRAVAADASQAAVNANQAASAAQRGQKNAEAQSEQDRLAAVSSDQQLHQAVQDREELRAKLLAQFNLIFVTRDTARGLIVNLSDVLFDSGKATLRPGAREKLAKVSGIILAYPDLRLAIEGNTDSVGSDAVNQTLSEQRAAAVRDYLEKESIPATSMTSKGFGKTQPVATNDTAEGRQQNRRVELVVSGEVIGTTIGLVSHDLPLTARPYSPVQ